LINDIGLSSIVAKRIYNKLHPAPQAAVPDDSTIPGGGQLVTFQHQSQIQMITMQNQMESQFSKMQFDMKVQQMEYEHKLKMQELESKNRHGSLEKDFVHAKEVQTLEKQKLEVEFKGQIALMEEKTKNKPVDCPAWWMETYGNWNPLLHPGAPSWWTPRPGWNPDGNSSHILSSNNRIATQTSTVGTIFSADGYYSGIHSWSIRTQARPSTCMIGVAPLSVPRTMVHYSTHGYFVNFDGGHAYSSKSGKNFPVTAGAVVDVILNCVARTLSYSLNKATPVVTHTGIIISERLFLAWNNDTTSGSVIEILWD